jgi:hypothetical protein
VFRASTEQVEKLRARVDPDTHPTLANRHGTAHSAPRKRGRPKKRITRDMLDGRCIGAKIFDQIAVNIHNDLGGHSKLTTIQLVLVDAFAGAKLTLDYINAKIKSGAEITNPMVAMHAQEINALVKLASRLGIQRQAAPTKDLDAVVLEIAAKTKASP